MKKGKISIFLDFLKGNHSGFFFFVMFLLFSVSIGISRWSVRESEKIHARLVRQQIYDFKKDLLRDTVRNFLREMDRMRGANRLRVVEEMENIIADIRHLDREHPERLRDGLLDILSQGRRRQMLGILLSDVSTGEILFSTESRPVAGKDRARYRFDQVLDSASLRLSMNINDAWVEDVTKREIADIIHSQFFENNSYIWVNEVLDWSGGDNYAIRRIHPNLIQTEGSFLSTKTTDVMGKTPYLTELEGIRDHGELFFQYHFKRKESDEVSEKLAYAVLYPDYNWIVAMGIHVDDIDYYVREVEKSSEDLNRHVLAVSSLILLAFFLFAAFFLDVSWRSFIEFRTRKIRKESNIDPLIGALNRRIGEEYFTGAFRRFRQGRASPVIFSVDIDDFKKVNDTWGHRVGDEVLKGVVERIKRTMRDSDYLFRWGGEEFLVVYESFRAMDMLQVADRLIHEVSSSPVTVAPDVVIAVDGSSSPAADSAEVFADGDLDIRVTVSTGISWFSPSDSSWEDAVTRSDRALYRAKAEGKNCSRMEPPGGSE